MIPLERSGIASNNPGLHCSAAIMGLSDSTRIDGRSYSVLRQVGY